MAAPGLRTCTARSRHLSRKDAFRKAAVARTESRHLLGALAGLRRDDWYKVWIMRKVSVFIALLPSISLGGPSWLVVWDGELLSPGDQNPPHLIEEVDTSSHVHTGSTAHVQVRNTLFGSFYNPRDGRQESLRWQFITDDLFDCVNATYTSQAVTFGSKKLEGPGPTNPVKLKPELALYQYACN